MVRRIWPFVLMVITFLACLFLKNDFLRFLFGFEILCLILCAVEARYLKGKVTGTLRIRENVVRRESSFQIFVNVRNMSPLPLPELSVRVTCEDRLSGEALLLKSKALLEEREEGDICFTLDADHCGALDFALDRISIRDHLGIFEAVCRTRKDWRSISVIPEEPEYEEDMSDHRARLSDEEGDEYRKGRSVIDSSDLRVYRIGDSLRHVHWKVSARTIDLMVREMGDPLEKRSLIYLNLMSEEEKIPREEWDHFLKAVSDFSNTMLKYHRPHTVIWVNKKEDLVEKHQIQDEESLREMLCTLLRTPVYESRDVSGLLREIESTYEKEETIEIDLQGHLIRWGQA